MKLQTKIAISIIVPVLFMLVLPFLVLKLCFDMTGMGFWFLSFFLVNPFIVISLSIIAGTEIKKLWWIPIMVSAVFPPFFAISINDWVWDMYFYSAIYIVLGLVSMFITHFVKNSFKNKSR